MTNIGFKGIDIRQTGSQIVFRVFETTAGTVLMTGTTTVELYELQSDGTLKSYDYSSNVFKTTALTMPTMNLTPQTGNNGTTNTGIWTGVLSSLTGLTIGAVYIEVYRNPLADSPVQSRQWQYGSAEGDIFTGTISNGQAYVSAWLLGANPNSLNASTFDNTYRQLYGQRLMAIAGTTSPSMSGIYVLSGSGTYNNQHCWTNGNNNLWYDVSTSKWVLGNSVTGTYATAYWTSTADELGPWTAYGTAVGTPVVTALDMPSSGKNFPLLATNSLGQVVSSAVQGNVTGSVANVTGTVGSVSGPVASVTGNIGGNVNGSVNSVVSTVNSSLVAILGTALSETVAGYLSTAFKKFFNVVLPTSTMNEITQVDAVTSITTPQSDTIGTTTLLGRLTATRASYLDNLNVGGNVASHSDSTTMQATILASLPTAAQIATIPISGRIATTSDVMSEEQAVLTAIGGNAFPSIANIASAILKDPANKLATNTDGSVKLSTQQNVTVQNYVTIPEAIVQNSQTPGIIAVIRGDTLRVALPLMGNIATRTKLVMTVKANIHDADQQAILQIAESTGLVVSNGRLVTNSTTASLIVSDPTLGTVNLEIDASVTASLAVMDMVWDVQVYQSAGITTPISGTMSVIADVTQSVT